MNKIKATNLTGRLHFNVNSKKNDDKIFQESTNYPSVRLTYEVAEHVLFALN